MVQVKKESVRNAILDSARDLFSERGYHGTTLLDIAQLAGTGVSSLYSYYPSKLHLLYAVVEPWQKECYHRLEAQVRSIDEPREKLRAILLGIWRDMPNENVGLANALIEALASADLSENKPLLLLPWIEQRLTRMLHGALQQTPIAERLLANLIIMAQDGYIIHRRLGDLSDTDVNRLVDGICDILMTAPNAAAPQKRSRTTKKADRAPQTRRKRAV